MRPRTQGEPTAAREVLAALPISALISDADERRERRSQNGAETTFAPGF